MTNDQKEFAFWNGMYRNAKSIANLISTHKIEFSFWSEIYKLVDQLCTLIKTHKVDPLQGKVREANTQSRVVSRG